MAIKVGITYPHGIALEQISYPPQGVKYEILERQRSFLDNIITPSIMWSKYNDKSVDIVEAPIFPVLTSKPLVYTPADAHTLFGFDFMGLPIPRVLRTLLVLIFLRKTKSYCIVFKSKAGLKSLDEYPNILIKKIADNSKVVYPAIKTPKRPLIKKNDNTIKLLFAGGDFFRKGGAHVVDVFLKLWSKKKNIELIMYTNPSLNDASPALAREYLEKIKNCSGIKIHPLIPRQEFLKVALSKCDIFLMPTYKESYGFAIQEAIAFGKPVIATDIFAIPEIVIHNKSGFLIPIKNHPFIKNNQGYHIKFIPSQFKEFVNQNLYNYLKLLINDNDLRIQFGVYGWQYAKNKFSFEKRNSEMRKIYEELL